MAEATTGQRTVRAIRTATVVRERAGQATEALRPDGATRRVSGRRLATGQTRVETTRHAAQSVETPAGAAHGRNHEMGTAAGGQQGMCTPIIQGGPVLREARVAARLTASARTRRQDTELAEFAEAGAEDHEVVEAVENTADCAAAAESRAHGEEGAGNSEAGAEDHEVVEEEYWLGDRTRMAHVSSKEVAKQGVFQLLVRLENKFVIHNVVLQRQRLILLYESFSKVPGLYEELLSTINGEQPGGEGIPWRKIRSLVLDTFSPPDWWAQTLELWRASQVQGSRPGHIWLNEFDHWMSVIQQCLPDHERALPDQFEAKLLRGGVSIRCHNALLGLSVGVDMNDPVQVKTQIRLVCSEYADGLAGEKKDKGELRRAAADSAQAASRRAKLWRQIWVLRARQTSRH